MAGVYVRTHRRKVDEIKTRDLVWVTPDTPLDEVARLMERRRVKRVPVLKGGSLVGIVGRADLLRALARALAEQTAQTGDDDIRERIFAELAKAPSTAQRSHYLSSGKESPISTE